MAYDSNTIEGPATLKQDAPLDRFAKQLCAFDERFQKLEQQLLASRGRLTGQEEATDRPMIGSSLANGSGTLGAIGSSIEAIAARMNHVEEIASFFMRLA